MTIYARRYAAVTYTGANEPEVLEFLSGVAGRTWTAVSSGAAQVVLEGAFPGESPTVVTVAAGETLTKQATRHDSRLGGPWSPEEFAGMFREVPDSAALAADIDALSDRLDALERS